MHTANDLILSVGQLGNLETESGKLRVPVKVLDARSVWGKRQLLVSPIGGDGEIWADASRVFARKETSVRV